MRDSSEHGSRGRSAWPGDRRRGERGTQLVELALVLPVLLMLTFGIITGGVAWDRSQSLMHGAREATRYGATLPVTAGEVDAWLDEVAAVAVVNADGNLAASAPGRYLCVALVGGPGGDSRRVVDGSGAPTYESASCFDDDLDGARVQTMAERTSELNAVLVRRTLTLTRTASAQFEAAP